MPCRKCGHYSEVVDDAEDKDKIFISLTLNTLSYIIPDYIIDDLISDIEEINKEDWRAY